MDRLGIAKKLMLMLMVPLSGLLVFSALLTSEKMGVVSSMRRLEGLSEVAISASQLVHELQRERGRTAAFLSSSTAEETADLQTQRARTDEVAATFRETVSKAELDGD